MDMVCVIDYRIGLNPAQIHQSRRPGRTVVLVPGHCLAAVALCDIAQRPLKLFFSTMHPLATSLARGLLFKSVRPGIWERAGKVGWVHVRVCGNNLLDIYAKY